jgi:hypothetical protein
MQQRNKWPCESLCFTNSVMYVSTTLKLMLACSGLPMNEDDRRKLEETHAAMREAKEERERKMRQEREWRAQQEREQYEQYQIWQAEQRHRQRDEQRMMIRWFCPSACVGLICDVLRASVLTPRFFSHLRVHICVRCVWCCVSGVAPSLCFSFDYVCAALLLHVCVCVCRHRRSPSPRARSPPRRFRSPTPVETDEDLSPMFHFPMFTPPARQPRLQWHEAPASRERSSSPSPHRSRRS